MAICPTVVCTPPISFLIATAWVSLAFPISRLTQQFITVRWVFPNGFILVITSNHRIHAEIVHRNCCLIKARCALKKN